MLETELLIGYEESGGLHLPRDLRSQSWPCRLGVPVTLGTHLSVVSLFCLINEILGIGGKGLISPGRHHLVAFLAMVSLLLTGAVQDACWALPLLGHRAATLGCVFRSWFPGPS